MEGEDMEGEGTEVTEGEGMKGVMEEEGMGVEDTEETTEDMEEDTTTMADTDTVRSSHKQAINFISLCCLSQSETTLCFLKIMSHKKLFLLQKEAKRMWLEKLPFIGENRGLVHHHSGNQHLNTTYNFADRNRKNCFVYKSQKEYT